MSQYLLRLGDALADVLEQACRAQPPQFAGYMANIEFWISEFAHVAAVRNGYDVRFETMRAASERNAQESGGHRNIDDVGIPYQSTASTTSRAERKESVLRCRIAIEKMVERALKLDLIDFARHDELLESIARVEG